MVAEPRPALRGLSVTGVCTGRRVVVVVGPSLWGGTCPWGLLLPLPAGPPTTSSGTGVGLSAWLGGGCAG